MQNKYCQNCRENTKQVFVESVWRCEECFNTHSEFLPHPESLLHEIRLAGSQIIQYGEERLKLLDEIELLRKAIEAIRDGQPKHNGDWCRRIAEEAVGKNETGSL